jgi:hypothetical protein
MQAMTKSRTADLLGVQLILGLLGSGRLLVEPDVLDDLSASSTTLQQEIISP